MIRVRVSAAPRARRGLGRLAPVLRRELARAVVLGAQEVRDEARDLLSQSGANGPSAPGEPPRRDTGRLRDSIFARLLGDGLTAQVGTGLDYGGHLEFGTRRISARPWLQPVFTRMKPRLKARIARAARTALGSGV